MESGNKKLVNRYRRRLDPEFKRSDVDARTNSRWDVKQSASSSNNEVPDKQRQGEICEAPTICAEVFSSCSGDNEFDKETCSSPLVDMQMNWKDSSACDFNPLYADPQQTWNLTSDDTDNEPEKNMAEDKRKEENNEPEEREYDSSMEEPGEHLDEAGQLDDPNPGQCEERGEREDYPLYSQIMFREANMSIYEVIQMANAIFLRHSLSLEARQAILQFVTLLAGPGFKNINLSKYHASKVSDPLPQTIKYNFFCSDCNKAIPQVQSNKFHSFESTCEKCGKVEVFRSESPNNIVSMDLKYQLQTLFRDPENLKDVLRNLEKIENRNVNAVDNAIKDVYDSRLYHKVLEFEDADIKKLTFNFNLDGMKLFKSSLRSLWPLQGVINEFSPRLRFKSILTLMLFVTNKEPTADFIQMYLDLFVAICRDLVDDPLVVYDDNGNRHKFILVPLCACVDAPVRALMQNRLQYSAYHGCTWCYIFGVHIGCVRFLITEKAVIRTHESHQKDVQDVIRLNRIIRGVRGEMALTQLLNFDCVWSFPVDELHNVFIGVVKYLWHIWTAVGYNITDLNKAQKISRAQVKQIDNFLSKVKLPHEIHRWFHSLSNPANLKGTEWKSFLLIHAYACLHGILPDDRLQSFMLLSQSIFYLLQPSISPQQLDLCELYLTRFVGDCQIFYSDEVMTYNIHSLLHFVHSVKMAGPLWSNSAFPYESNMHILRKQTSGPKGVLQQISKRNLQILTLKNPDGSMSQTAAQFCKSLFAPYQLKHFYRDEETDAVLIGQKRVEDENVVVFDRCIYDNVIYRSTMYTRSAKTDDTVVMLRDNTVLQILRFESHNGHCYIVGNKFITVPVRVQSNNVEAQLSFYSRVVEILKDYEIKVGIENIHRKLVNVQVINKHYVVMMPNCFEIQ